MIFYDYDSSAILTEPLKSRSKAELLRAFTKCLQHLSSQGLRPALHIIDKECPKDLKNYIRNAGATLQLATPNMHQTNAAKKAIDVWKCYFMAGLSTVTTSATSSAVLDLLVIDLMEDCHVLGMIVKEMTCENHNG